MALKPEAVEQFYRDRSIEARTKVAAEDKERLRKQADRRFELMEQLLSEPWGRELFYDMIVDAGVLKQNPMTGNSQSFYIMGLQKVAKDNMDWVKEFHFKQWIKMEQEARNRRKEEEHERGK